jgi:uncharacterized protein YcnI
MKKPALSLALSALALASAHAHVSIENPDATAGAYAKVVLQVTHGCEGSPTRAVTVFVPPGFLLAKARAKAGWSISYEQVPLARPIDLHGRQVTKTTSVVKWEGGLLPNDQFDEFALIGRVAGDARGAMSFRVLQACEKGELDWKGAPGDAAPAAVLNVMPASAEQRHH